MQKALLIKKKLTEANIPPIFTYNGQKYKIASIGDRAFDACSSLKSVKITNGVTSIGDYAFSGCGYYEDTAHLTLDIPKSVTSIGYYAFYNVNNIKNK